MRALRVALSAACSLAVPFKPTFDSVRCGFTFTRIVQGFAEHDLDLSNFLAAPSRMVRLFPGLGIKAN